MRHFILSLSIALTMLTMPLSSIVPATGNDGSPAGGFFASTAWAANRLPGTMARQAYAVDLRFEYASAAERLNKSPSKLTVTCSYGDWTAMPEFSSFFGWLLTPMHVASQWVSSGLAYWFGGDTVRHRQIIPLTKGQGGAMGRTMEVGGREGSTDLLVKVHWGAQEGTESRPTALLHLVVANDDLDPLGLDPEDRCAEIKSRAYQGWIEYRGSEFARRMVETETWMGIVFSSFDVLLMTTVMWLIPFSEWLSTIILF